MTNKDKVKSLLKELFTITKNFSFLDAPLNDGKTSIRTTDETVKEGSPVQLVGGDGAVTDVKDGDYTLADGSVLSVAGGKVSAVKAASTDAALAVEAPVAPVAAADEEDAEDEEEMAKKGHGPEVDMDADALGSVVEAIKALSDRLAAIEDKVSTTKMEVEKMNEVLNEGEESSTVASLKAVGYSQGTIGHTIEKYKSLKKNRKFENLKALNSLRGTPMKEKDMKRFSNQESDSKIVEKFRTAPKVEKEETRTEKFSAPASTSNIELGFGNMSFS